MARSSDTGSASDDKKTNDDTPDINISLKGEGDTAPVAGDTVQVFADGNAIATLTLTAAQITARTAVVTMPSLGVDGVKKLTAKITDAAANVSRTSAPLNVTLDRTPPDLSSVTVDASTVTAAYVEAGTGLSAQALAVSSFSVVVNGTAVGVNSAKVDVANKKLVLTLAVPVSAGDVVTLNASEGAVLDIAGNPSKALNAQAVQNVTKPPSNNGGGTPQQGNPPPKSPVPTPPAAVNPPQGSNVITTVIPSGQPATPQPGAIDTSAARFNSPTGIARDIQGNLYIADQGNFTIRKIAVNGAVTTFAGKAGVKGDADGPATDARFTAPAGVAVDKDGNVYVIDNKNLRKITPDGVVSTLVATPANSTGGPNTFGLPSGIAVDSTGNIFITDYLTGSIWKVTPTGEVAQFTTIGSGIAAPAGAGPIGIAIDASDNLYITDLPFSLSASAFSSVYKVSPAGVITTLYGPSAGLINARGIAIDTAGNLVINENLLIVKISPTSSLTAYQLPAASAGITISASSLTIDPSAGTIFFTDSALHTVDRLNTDGTVNFIAGKAGQAGAQDVAQ